MARSLAVDRGPVTAQERIMMADAVMAERTSFPALLQRLHEAKHTGPVLLHFSQGAVSAADILKAPTHVKLGKA